MQILGVIITLAVTMAAVSAMAERGSKEPVVIDLNPGELVITPCNDHIARITVTPSGSPTIRKSLAVIADWPPRSYTTRTEGHLRIIRLPKLTVQFDTQTKRLSFYNPSGKLLLREAIKPRTFKKQTIMGDSSYNATEIFDMPPNQAFYGLGCQQKSELNLFGQAVDMFQHNMFEGVPFFISTAGYGILWDNPSETNYNFGAETEMLPTSAMYDLQKQPGGLSATYYAGEDFQIVESQTKEGPIDFDWKNRYHFSARWEGFVKTRLAGTYRFRTDVDDGARLWVNGKLIINDWSVHAVSTTEAAIDLPADTLVPIKLEYFQALGDAVLRLHWSPAVKADKIKIQSDVADQIDYYFIAGPDLDSVVKGYRETTGHAPMFGKWAYGFWQCKERYKSAQELLDVAERYRSRNIPIDNIVQDWFYWDPYPWGSHKMDPKRYPDPAALLKELHERYHLHAMISVWAKFAAGSENEKELSGKGLLYSEAAWKDEPERYYDAFSPEGRAIYWRQIRDELYKFGWDAWWLDATEPEINIDEWKKTVTAAGPARRVLNAYPLMTTEAVYKGQRAASEKQRVFILTRSVYAGQQRNGAATWSGDISATWDVFRRQVASGLNFCAAGVPYWCTDIGAFFSKPNTDPGYRELFTRWFEWGTFNPIFRVHGTGTDKELWRFGPETEKALVKYDNLRYRLMPYIYSLAWQVTSNGYTMMRPVAMDFRTDGKTWNLSDQLMFGPALLVSPVVEEGAVSRTLYLPKGTWYDFWSGAPLVGGKEINVAAPIDMLPIHVRAGSIVPMGPFLQYAAEKLADPIELRVYPGADGRFTLYEDSGDGYGYEHGERATISLSWNDKERKLTIGKRRGSFPGMLLKRTFHILLVKPGRGTGLDITEKTDRAVAYNGKAISVAL